MRNVMFSFAGAVSGPGRHTLPGLAPIVGLGLGLMVLAPLPGAAQGQQPSVTQVAQLAADTGTADTGAAEHGPYDLLFRDGTLDALPDGGSLTYERRVTNTAAPQFAERDTGQIVLQVSRPEGAPAMASLDFRQDGKHRGMGSFPASVGNPMIMVFHETVARDMAETAGGSPFYIRNRLKDALVSQAEITTGTALFDGRSIETVTVTLHPFRGDPNAARMQGFQDLALRVEMSPEVPGWYLALDAVAAPEGGAPVYESHMRHAGMQMTPAGQGQ